MKKSKYSEEQIVKILDVEVFHNMADAQVKLSIFRRFYNEQRPHS